MEISASTVLLFRLSRSRPYFMAVSMYPRYQRTLCLNSGPIVLGVSCPEQTSGAYLIRWFFSTSRNANSTSSVNEFSSQPPNSSTTSVRTNWQLPVRGTNNWSFSLPLSNAWNQAFSSIAITLVRALFFRSLKLFYLAEPITFLSLK